MRFFKGRKGGFFCEFEASGSQLQINCRVVINISNYMYMWENISNCRSDVDPNLYRRACRAQGSDEPADSAARYLCLGMWRALIRNKSEFSPEICVHVWTLPNPVLALEQ